MSYRALVAAVILLSLWIPFSGSDRRVLWPVCLLLPLLIPAVERLFRVRLGAPMKCFVLLFAALSFPLGVVLCWYDLLPGFDKLIHGLSGVLFTVAGLCLYSRSIAYGSHLRHPLLPISVAFFFSMSVAAFWEIGEFLGFLLTGHDAQHHLTTGVFDTMVDMIVCALGSAAAALDLWVGSQGGRSLLGKVVRSFQEANAPPSKF